MTDDQVLPGLTRRQLADLALDALVRLTLRDMEDADRETEREREEAA